MIACAGASPRALTVVGNSSDDGAAGAAVGDVFLLADPIQLTFIESTRASELLNLLYEALRGVLCVALQSFANRCSAEHLVAAGIEEGYELSRRDRALRLLER